MKLGERLGGRFVVILILCAIAGIAYYDYEREGGRFSLAPPGVEVLLYFADRDASYLVPELRRYPAGAEYGPELILQGLIEGPHQPELSPTVPPTTRVLQVEQEGDLLKVVFSRELRDDHRAPGSAGEIMTIFSIVNSLTELPGVERVLIGIEGDEERIDQVLFHLALDEPYERNESLIYRP